jgi:hypothetical protein
MTIETTETSIQRAGNGVTTAFQFPYRVFHEDDLIVSLQSAGTWSLLARDLDYTVAINARGIATVTMAIAPANGESLDIRSDISLTQPTQIRDLPRFLPEVHENEFDRLLRQIQDLKRQVQYALRLSDIGSPQPVMNLPSFAGRYIFVNDAGQVEPAELLTAALTQSSFNQFLGGFSGSMTLSGLSIGAVVPGSVARAYVNESITAHAHYAFLDESLINYAGGAPIYGHASFNSAVRIQGAVASDHHHDFQAYPIVTVSATITRVAGFFARGDHSGSGVVTSWMGHAVYPPTGSGPINNFYGVYIAPLLGRATGNTYGIYVEGEDKSLFGGDIQMGAPATPATIRYEYVSGNLELIPRTSYKVHVKSELLIDGADASFASSIRNNAGNGHMEIAPRTSGVVKPQLDVLQPMSVNGPVTLKSLTVAQLASTVLPADWPNSVVYVSNETGGATIAFSDGSAWRRCQDLAVVS